MDGIAAEFQEQETPKKSWYENLVDGLKNDWDIFTDHIQAGFDEIAFNQKWDEIKKLDTVKHHFEVAFNNIDELTATALNKQLTEYAEIDTKHDNSILKMYGVKMKDFAEYAESLTPEDWQNMLETRQEKRAEWNRPLVENETINFET